MARLITKFKYLKPSNRLRPGGYAKYIATREGVEKIDESFKRKPVTVDQKQLIAKILRDFPGSKNSLEYEDYRQNQTVGTASEFITRTLEENAAQMVGSKTYADYIATRPRAQRFGSHGLFTDDGVAVNLSRVSEELNLHEGNVWTAIISLRREDAERLGYNTGERWRDMLRSQTQELSDQFHIPMQNLKWFAAFHNESHHPHVHLLVYSETPKEGYLSKQGINALRSSFAKDIFAQELVSIYERQTVHRDELKADSRERMAGIVSQINSGTYNNPRLEEMLLRLADRLSRTSGKKVYGYLKADVKALVDAVVDGLAADERIAALYALWYGQREEVIRTYTDEIPERVPLSQNREFKSIKNTVIQEAMNIAADRTLIEEAEEPSAPEAPDMDADPPPDEPIEPDDHGASYFYGGGRKKKQTWWTEGYKQARKQLYGTKDTPPDFETALTLMETEAAKGNGFAMHDLGKMHLSGLGCEKDEVQAQAWFAKAYHAFIAEEAKAKEKGYLQYRIGKLYSFGYGVDQDYLKAAGWYEKAVAEDNPFAAYALGSLYRRGQGVEQDDTEAFRLYTKAAEHKEKPNAYAAYELGRMCRDGVGTEKNQVASDAWYKQAYQGFLTIEQSMADDKLYYRLGQMNLTGTGTETNVPLAKQYFEKAARLDNPDALYGLGKLHLKKGSAGYDPQKAAGYLSEAAKRGHAYAQYTLGRLFLKGGDVPKNVPYALYWLEEAVKQENPQAEYLLGKALLEGEDVERDLPRAVGLLRRSVAQGNGCAMYTLGQALLDGELSQPDIPEALRLITVSAGSGFAPAQYLLGKLLYKGEVIPQDLNKAIAWLESAAARQNPYAAYLAGKILLTEETVKDIPRAIRNFEIAAENGNDYAEYQLGKLYLYGKDVQRDEEKAIAYLTSSAGHGNQYAAQLLHSMAVNRDWSAAVASLRLLGQISRAIQRRLEDGRKTGTIDRKLRRKMDEKKLAHGLKIG